MPREELWPLAMKLRDQARSHGHEDLADTYLLIAAADLYGTLDNTLVDLLFLDLTILHVKRHVDLTDSALVRKYERILRRRRRLWKAVVHSY